MEECDYFKLRNFISSRLDSGASFRIPLISEMEVSNLFKSIASNKVTGHDGLNPRRMFITPLLSFVQNESDIQKLENFQR